MESMQPHFHSRRVSKRTGASKDEPELNYDAGKSQVGA
jgi:hypothetical protein